MRHFFLITLVMLFMEGYANMDITYEVDEGNLHIRYQTGGWEDRGGKMEALLGTLKFAEKQKWFKEPTLIHVYEFIPSKNNGTYKLGYGNFQFSNNRKILNKNGLSLFFYGKKYNIEDLLHLIFYAIENKEEIRKSTFKSSIKPDYADEIKDLNTIPDSSISFILKGPSVVPVDIWKQRIEIYLKYRQNLFNLSCYYQNKNYHFCYNPENPKTYKIDPTKEVVLLKLSQFYEFSQNEDGDQFIFPEYNNFYYISRNLNSIVGPLLIGDVNNNRYPVRFISHTYEPYDNIEFLIDGDTTRNKVLFIVNKKFLIEHYDFFQKRLIDSLSKPTTTKGKITSPSDFQLILFLSICLFFVLGYFARYKLF